MIINPTSDDADGDGDDDDDDGTSTHEGQASCASVLCE